MKRNVEVPRGTIIDLSASKEWLRDICNISRTTHFAIATYIGKDADKQVVAVQVTDEGKPAFYEIAVTFALGSSAWESAIQRGAIEL